MRALVSFNRESCTPTCAERNFLAIRHSQVVQGDLLVVYQLELKSLVMVILTNLFFNPHQMNHGIPKNSQVNLQDFLGSLK